MQPIVTYAGDRSVFTSIEPGLVSVLPTEAVEWENRYGRNNRQVYVRISFQPFTTETVASSGSLLGQPIFHTFKTDVGDMDLYRQGVKDDILTWLNTLKKVEFNSDWMILVVETPENRKGNYAGHAEGRGRQDPRQVCGTDGPQQGRLQGS